MRKPVQGRRLRQPASTSKHAIEEGGCFRANWRSSPPALCELRRSQRSGRLGSPTQPIDRRQVDGAVPQPPQGHGRVSGEEKQADSGAWEKRGESPTAKARASEEDKRKRRKKKGKDKDPEAVASAES